MRKSIKSTVYWVAVLGALLLAGCRKQDVPESPLPPEGKVINPEANFRTFYPGLSEELLQELQQARAGTAKYRNMKNALKDGYEDINVVLPNMGYHFMQLSSVDDRFEIRRPEILVYHKLEDGSFQLVAVEYAVPIELSPNTAPEGFSGTDDVWKRDTGFGLWLLHAWVWYFNPEGVFHSTNPLIHVE